MKVNRDSFDQRNLWKRIKAGEADAFDHLYDQYVDILFSFGLTFSQDPELVKDSIHDLFFELYKYRKKLSDTDNIKNYLFKSLKRKIYAGQSRKLKINYTPEVLDLPNLKRESVEENIIEAEQKDETFLGLSQGINELPERQREALTLKFNAELSYVEIAGLMNISVESVRTLIYRSLKTLRQSLSNKFNKNPIILFLVELIPKIRY